MRDGRADSFGVWNGYPPRGVAKDPLFDDLWSQREPIEGGTIEPGENVSFLLHLTGAPAGRHVRSDRGDLPGRVGRHRHLDLQRHLPDQFRCGIE